MQLENQFIKLLEYEFREIIKAEISGREPSRMRVLEVLEHYKELSMKSKKDNTLTQNVVYTSNPETAMIIQKANRSLRKIQKSINKKKEKVMKTFAIILFGAAQLGISIMIIKYLIQVIRGK